MKKCIQCGTEMNDFLVYCPKCGQNNGGASNQHLQGNHTFRYASPKASDMMLKAAKIVGTLCTIFIIIAAIVVIICAATTDKWSIFLYGAIGCVITAILTSITVTIMKAVSKRMEEQEKFETHLINEVLSKKE